MEIEKNPVYEMLCFSDSTLVFDTKLFLEDIIFIIFIIFQITLIISVVLELTNSP